MSRTQALGAGVYADLRVLELGSGTAVPLATRYFAEQGATVVRLEPARRSAAPCPSLAGLRTGGADAAPERALLHAGKRAVALDLGCAEGVALALRLVDWADVVAESAAPDVLEGIGLHPAGLLERRPELIVLSASPLGRTGPPHDPPVSPDALSALAGFDHLTGWPDREPLAPYGTITGSLAARYAAVLIAAALLERARSGRGQHLDLAELEVGAHALSELVVSWTGAGASLARAGNRSARAAPHGIYPCHGADAWIALEVHDDAQWEALVAAMGDPPWAAEPRFATQEARLAHVEELDRRIAEWTAEFAPYELMAGLQNAGVPAGVVQTPELLLRDPQLAHRGHFVRVEHPRLGTLVAERSGFRLAGCPGGFAGAGPLPGEHTDAVLREILGLASDAIGELRARGVVD